MLSYAIHIPDGDILNYYNVDQTCRQELLVFNNTDIHMVNFIEILIKYTIVLNFPDLIEYKSDFYFLFLFLFTTAFLTTLLKIYHVSTFGSFTHDTTRRMHGQNKHTDVIGVFFVMPSHHSLSLHV